MVGILSLILLAIAVLGVYVFKISGPWRLIFIITATAALWLDAFVGVIQAFAKLTGGWWGVALGRLISSSLRLGGRAFWRIAGAALGRLISNA
jgi:hypothetical protein